MSERSRAERLADEHRHELNRQLRAAFIEGAEERSRKAHGRGLTDEELRRIMREDRASRGRVASREISRD